VGGPDGKAPTTAEDQAEVVRDHTRKSSNRKPPLSQPQRESSEEAMPPHHVIVRTPLRVSFTGGGSDILPGCGAVVCCTIDKHVYVVAKRRTDSKIYVTWREKEVVDSRQEVKHDLIREALNHTGFTYGVEILTYADVPGVGSGLGSSAATLLGTLHALLALRGRTPDQIAPRWLAGLAVSIQRDVLHKRQGYQDEYACALGGLNYLSIGGTRWFMHGNVEPINGQAERKIALCETLWEDMCDHFALFSPRNSSGRDSESILSEFRDSMEFRKFCCESAEQAEDAILKGEWSRLHDEMWSHHIEKTKAFPRYWPYPWPAVDEATYQFKLCGAGGTGHLLVGCDRRNRAEVIAKMSQVWGPELPFRFVRYGSQVVFWE
jgi:D-glycero-alpha-D-manno-heptose-7-phosphate kinase